MKVVEKYETAANTKKSVKDIDPDLLLMYDEYAIEKRKPYVFRRTQKEFAKDMNQKYNTSYSVGSLNYYFRKISDEGIRSPLPPIYEY